MRTLVIATLATAILIAIVAIAQAGTSCTTYCTGSGATRFCTTNCY